MDARVFEQAGFHVRELDLLSVLPFTQGKATTVGVCLSPALFIYADEDVFVKPQHTLRLHAAYGAWDDGIGLGQAAHGPEKVLVACGGNHNSERPDATLEQAASFLWRHLQEKPDHDSSDSPAAAEEEDEEEALLPVLVPEAESEAEAEAEPDPRPQGLRQATTPKKKRGVSGYERLRGRPRRRQIRPRPPPLALPDYQRRKRRRKCQQWCCCALICLLLLAVTGGVVFAVFFLDEWLNNTSEDDDVNSGRAVPFPTQPIDRSGSMSMGLDYELDWSTSASWALNYDTGSAAG